MVREVVGRPVPAGISRSFELASTALASPAGEPHALYDLTKRATDVVLASLLLVLTLPLLLLAALAIFVTTGRSPLLLQRRVGWLGYEFTLLKLRTMRPPGHCEEAAADAAISHLHLTARNAAASGDPPPYLTPKLPSDIRVTRVGRLLRRTSIDELPQLLNVIAGQMTLVGPRPGLPSEVAEYRSSWMRRLSVRPGLSGLWQVSGRSSLPVERWMALDRCYVTRRSLGFDLRILARTVLAVVSMRGAW